MVVIGDCLFKIGQTAVTDFHCVSVEDFASLFFPSGSVCRLMKGTLSQHLWPQ